MLRTLPYLLVALFLTAPPTRAAEGAVQLYERHAARAEAGACVDVTVDLSASPGFSVEVGDGGAVLRYRMAFNNIAEGWSWQPLADPQHEDYYRFKFLPLQSVEQARGSYRAEDKIGVEQEMQVIWRYDYFLAFDNLYEFYPRSDDDDAGFAVRVSGTAPAHPAMRAHACLQAPVVSESTTFWKAIHGRPSDFTLKKRYLVGHLDSIEFLDQDTGQVLGKLTAPAAH